MTTQRVSEGFFQSCLALTAMLALMSQGCGGGPQSTTRHGSPGATAGIDGGAGTSTGKAGAGASGRGAAGSGASGTGTAGSGAGGTGTAGGGGAQEQDGGTKRVFDAGSDPNRNQVVAGQLCDRLATIECAGEAFCCTNPGRTEAQCKDTMSKGCTTSLMMDDVAADPISGFDQTQAAMVYTNYEDRASKCDQGIATWGESVDGMRGILRGTRNPGTDCAPATTTLTDKVKSAAALASCNNLATHACLPAVGGVTGLMWTCAPKNGGGGACFTDVNCTAGLYCDNPNLALNAKCKTRKTPGSACQNPNECASLFCKKSTCVAVSQDAAFCLQN